MRPSNRELLQAHGGPALWLLAAAALLILSQLGCATTHGSRADREDQGSAGGWALPPLQLEVFGQGYPPANGGVSATTGTFSAGITATTGTFSSSISATSGTFSAGLIATTGAFSGAVSGTTGTFSSSISATSGTFSAGLIATTGAFSGAVSGTTGTFSGAISSTTAAHSGTITSTSADPALVITQPAKICTDGASCNYGMFSNGTANLTLRAGAATYLSIGSSSNGVISGTLSITAGLTVPAGTAGAPSLVIGNSTTAGLFASGTNFIDVVTGGVSRATFYSGGVQLGSGGVVLNSTGTNLQVAGGIMPLTASTYTLGTTSKVWGDLYVVAVRDTDGDQRLNMTNAASTIVYGNDPDGASAIGVKIANSNVYTTAGAKIASFYTGNGAVTERAAVDKDGAIQLNISGGSGQPACAVGNRGKVWYTAGAGGALDKLEVCRKDAADAYAWVTLF